MNKHENPKIRRNYAIDLFYLVIFCVVVLILSEDKRVYTDFCIKKIAEKDSIIAVLLPKATLWDSGQARVQAAKDHIKKLVEEKK